MKDSASRSFAHELLADDRLARRALTIMELMPEAEALLLQRFFAAVQQAILQQGEGFVELVSAPATWDRNQYLTFTLKPTEAKSVLWKDFIVLGFELTRSGDASWGICWEDEHVDRERCAEWLVSEFGEEEGGYRDRDGDWPVWWDLGLVPGSRLKGAAALRPMHTALCERKVFDDLAERVISVMIRADKVLARAVA